LEFRVMVQAAVPVQPPPVHEVKAKLLAAFGVRVTFVPAGKAAVHVPVLQLIPVGALVTVPEPATVTDRVGSAKFAVTARLELTVNMQVLVPEHAPLQPPKRKFVPGVAVSVTCVPIAKVPVHAPGQLIPAGLLVTFPVPTMVTETLAETAVNVAVTAWLEVRVTAHVPVPEHSAPLQLVKTEFAFGVAVSVTAVLGAKLAEHVPAPGQVIPAGLLVTVPPPVPASVTRSPSLLAVYNETKASGHTTVRIWLLTRSRTWHCGAEPSPPFRTLSATAAVDEAWIGKFVEFVSPTT